MMFIRRWNKSLKLTLDVNDAGERFTQQYVLVFEQAEQKQLRKRYKTKQEQHK